MICDSYNPWIIWIVHIVRDSYSSWLMCNMTPSPPYSPTWFVTNVIRDSYGWCISFVTHTVRDSCVTWPHLHHTLPYDSWRIWSMTHMDSAYRSWLIKFATDITHIETASKLHRPPPLTMGWLRLVGTLKLQVYFAKESYKRNDILQKRPIIFRSLLSVATPYQIFWVSWEKTFPRLFDSAGTMNQKRYGTNLSLRYFQKILWCKFIICFIPLCRFLNPL